jgi:hypothetical protein
MSLPVNSINTGFVGPFAALSLPFASFVTLSGSGANFASVGAVKLLIDETAAPGFSMSIDMVTAEADLAQVPEPGTFVLASGALVGLGLLRRRKA